MKVQIKVRPLGGYNGAEWPERGDVIDLPDHIAESMLKSGHVVKPSSAEAKKDKAEAKVETAVAPKASVETAVKKTTTKK